MSDDRYGRYPDSDDEIEAALTAHGYDPDLEPRGVTGPPGVFDGLAITADGVVPVKLRNWVCVLDGIMIDGHSDPDNSGMCIYCLVDLD